MLVEVILVLVFGKVKFLKLLKRCQFGDDRIVPMSGRPFHGCFECFFLRFIFVKHDGAVLGADIGTLAVEGGRVVDKEVNIENGFSRDGRFVKSNTHNFRVAGGSGRDLVVTWFPCAAGVAAFYLRNALNTAVHRVQTPKTASSEYVCCHTFIIRRYNKRVNSDEFQELLQERGAELYRPMPWREDTRPYYVLVSELMLQQTQVDRVIPKFLAFIERFPDVQTLARASLGDVLTLWSGLGYNRRAKFLHDAARKIVREFNGVFPVTKEALMSLPGVGPNTAGALLAYAYNQPVIFVETNVRTVYFHHFFEDGEKVSDRQVATVVEVTIDKEHPREFYWALMDYGTFLKKQGAGRIHQSKHYKKQSALKGSVREVRGQIIRALTRGNATEEELRKTVLADERFEPALTGLTKDGLVLRTNGQFHLTNS